MPSIRIDAPAKTTFLVHLPADLGRRLREHAVTHGVTITGTFRAAVRRYLNTIAEADPPVAPDDEAC